MPYSLLLFTGLMIACVLLLSIGNKEVETFNFRRKQTQNMLKENAWREKINDYAKKNVKFSKRHKIETTCLQAGFKLTYGDYLIISWLTAIIMGVTLGIMLNNPFIGLLFLFIGYNLPLQVITFIKNRRLSILEKQIGSFMQMVIKRYESTHDFKNALELTLQEFKGEQPMYGEIRQTLAEINLGVPIHEAMDNMARRTGNKYMRRLADFYAIASNLGTDEVRKDLLWQAYLQYEENRKTQMVLKKEISSTVRDAYIMLFGMIGVACYMALINPDYIPFMTTTTTGKIGVAFFSLVFLGAIWFINTKIAAPIE